MRMLQGLVEGLTDISFGPLFGKKKGYKQNSRLKYMNLMQNRMENRLRRASDPVHTNNPLYLNRPISTLF